MNTKMYLMKCMFSSDLQNHKENIFQHKSTKNSILKSSQVFRIDYFDPSTYKGASDSYIAFTNASLEQTGDKYIEFMNFLFSNPQCVGGIHIEPIRELLSLDSDLNKQSYEYAEKRQYLTNFFNFFQSSGQLKN